MNRRDNRKAYAVLALCAFIAVGCALLLFRMNGAI